MTINISLKKLKDIFKNRLVLSVIAILCAVAIILIVTFFSRYVFDCVSVKNSITVTNVNTVSYEVYYSKNEFYPDNAKINNGVQTYTLGYTDRILIKNNCSADFSKEAKKVSVSYAVTANLIIRQQGNGNQLLYSKITDLTQSLQDTQFTSIQINPNAAVDTDYANASLLRPLEVRLENYIKSFEEYHDWFVKQNKSTRLNAELVVEFAFSVKSNVSGENTINSSSKRGVSIPITSETYKIDVSGQETSVKTFPERKIQFPNAYLTVFITLLVAGLIILLVYSTKTFFADPDLYKRKIKAILRKFGNEIVMADKNARLPELLETIVESFKELIKFSQISQKPIICLRCENSTVFYVQSDNTLYEYEITADDENEVK